MLTSPHTSERVFRYRDLGGLKQALTDDIAVIGVGAIGRQIALQLAQMGIENLTLYDPDTVEEVNLGPQGYAPSQIGTLKVLATANDCLIKNPECSITPDPTSFPSYKGHNRHSTFFICVDSMSARNTIASDSLPKERVIDTRMGGLSGRIITDRCKRPTQSPPETRFPTWRHSLHTDEEAFDAPCSLTLTSYGAMLIAARGVAEYMALLQGREPVDLSEDIMARNITHNKKASSS